VLVDLDLRTGELTRALRAIDHPGIAVVALGEAALDDVLVPVPLGAPSQGSNGGDLHVLGTGPLPPRPGELVASAVVAAVLSELRTRADLVLVVAPPLLSVGDAVALGASVDALVLVSRLGALRTTRIRELKRVLGTWPAATLGFVLTGVEAQPPPNGGSWLRRLAGRFRRAGIPGLRADRATGTERAAESWP
jgi:Mrp family chromosome partitioning ATPase